MCSLASRPMFLAVLAAGVISVVVAAPGPEGRNHSQLQDGKAGEAQRRGRRDPSSDTSRTRGGKGGKGGQRKGRQLQDADAGDAQQLGRRGPSKDKNCTKGGKGGKGGQLKGEAADAKGFIGISHDKMPFIVAGVAVVVLTLTAVVAMVFCRRCRAKASRSLQSDAARVEQGEVAEGSSGKDVVTTGVPFDNIVVTGIPVDHEGVSASATAEARRVSV